MKRRRKLGYDMYSLMGIGRQDKAKRASAMLENFDFFGAPVGMIVTVDAIVDKNGWGHVGCMLQVVNAARADLLWHDCEQGRAQARGGLHEQRFCVLGTCT